MHMHLQHRLPRHPCPHPASGWSPAAWRASLRLGVWATVSAMVAAIALSGLVGDAVIVSSVVLVVSTLAWRQPPARRAARGFCVVPTSPARAVIGVRPHAE